MTESLLLDPFRAQLAADRATLRTVVDEVPLDWRERRVHPDRWSVAEILEHLAKIEKSMVMLVTGFVTAAPEGTPAKLGNRSAEALRALLLDRNTKIDAPGFIQPNGSMDSETAMRALEEHREELLAAISRADGRDLSTVSRAHRVFGELNGYEWLWLIAGHEARHAAQIAELAEQISQQPS